MALPISPFPLINFIPSAMDKGKGSGSSKEKKICADDQVSTLHPPPFREDDDKGTGGVERQEREEKNITALTESSAVSFESFQEAVNARVALIKKLRAAIATKNAK